MEDSLSLEKINKNLVEFGIEPENQIEEAILKFAPAIREIIKSGRDVEESFKTIANTLGITQHRFQQIYMAVKKEMQMETDMRGGPDLRLGLMNDLDVKIQRVEKERLEFIENREDAIKKYKTIAAKRKECDEKGETYSGEELAPFEATYVFMKPDSYYRTLKGFDETLARYKEQKTKISGVLVQKKEIIHSDAAAIMQLLFKNQNPMEIEATGYEILEEEDEMESLNG